MNALEQLDRTILLCRDHVLDELSNEEICSNFLSFRVLCVSDLRNLSSHSGQTALVTLVSMLNRMGMQVGLAIPDVPIINPQPPVSGASMLQVLTASSEAFISGATVCKASGFRPDLVFALGNTDFAKGSAPCWRLSGSEWCGALTIDGVRETPPWTADWSIGSMVSAALASSEAFKFVMRLLPFRNQADQVFFEMSPVCNWDFGLIPVPDKEIDLGHVDLISAGAICQAVLYALLRLPRVRLSGRIFDDDITAPSNLNRNLLSTVADIGSSKVQIVAQRCGTQLQLDPVRSRFLDDGRYGELADRVLVGVDDIPSRWGVQRKAPHWLAISGTSHFNVSSSAHEPETPCSGCLHPVDDNAAPGPIPTVSFVSFWAGLVMAVRLVREAIGLPYPVGQQHLWLTPLRMDLRNAAMWYPVAAIRHCPARCHASQAA
jgi:hypothetical protein